MSGEIIMKKYLLNCLPLIAVVLFLLAVGTHYSMAADDNVRITAEKLVYEQDKKNITLLGNVRFIYKNTTLSGERANFNTASRVGIITGNVRIYQPGTTIVGDKMTVWYNKKTSELSGNVKIVTIRDVKNTPGEKQDMLASGLTTLTCKKFNYNWITREGKAQGDVFVEQKDRRAYAETAHYSGTSDLITLEDKVRFEQGSNNWVTCKKAYIDMRKETFMAVGGVTGNFLVQTEEEKKKTKDTKKAPPSNADKIIIPDLPFEERKLTE